jgi:hypothetical protein
MAFHGNLLTILDETILSVVASGAIYAKIAGTSIGHMAKAGSGSV